MGNWTTRGCANSRTGQLAVSQMPPKERNLSMQSRRWHPRVDQQPSHVRVRVDAGTTRVRCSARQQQQQQQQQQQPHLKASEPYRQQQHMSTVACTGADCLHRSLHRGPHVGRRGYMAYIHNHHYHHLHYPRRLHRGIYTRGEVTSP